MSDMSVFERTVSEYMSSPVCTVSADDTVEDAHKIMTEKRISCLAVVGRDEKPAGVVSRSDLLRIGRVMVYATGSQTALQLPSMCVGDLMTPRFFSVSPGQTLVDAAREMVERRIHRVFVVDAGKPIGVVSTKDLMRAVMDAKVATPIAELMTVPVVTVEASAPLSDAVATLSRARISGVAVMENGVPVGIFTQEEALAARDRPGVSSVDESMSQAMLCLPVSTPMFRAAGFTISTRARRVLAIDHHHLKGVLTGLDFARCLLPTPPSTVASVA